MEILISSTQAERDMYIYPQQQLINGNMQQPMAALENEGHPFFELLKDCHIYLESPAFFFSFYFSVHLH